MVTQGKRKDDPQRPEIQNCGGAGLQQRGQHGVETLRGSVSKSSKHTGGDPPKDIRYYAQKLAGMLMITEPAEGGGT